MPRQDECLWKSWIALSTADSRVVTGVGHVGPLPTFEYVKFGLDMAPEITACPAAYLSQPNTASTPAGRARGYIRGAWRH